MPRFPRSLSATFVLLFLLASFHANAQTNFGSVNVGSSATATVTVTVPSASSFTALQVVTMGQAGLDYTASGTGTCATGVAYSAGQTCTVGVTFKPLGSGLRKGAVILSDPGKEFYAIAFLQGIGKAPQFTFSPGTATAIYPTLNGYSLTYLSPTEEFAPGGGLAIDGAGNIYIANPVLNSDYTNIASYGILQLTPGSSAATFLPVEARTGSYIQDPTTVRVDGAGNRIVNGAFGWTIVLPLGATSGTLFSTSVVSIDPAVDGAGNLFLYEKENDGHILSYLGENLDVKGPGATVTPDDFVQAMTLDAAGDLFLATPGQILKVLPSQLSLNPAPAITGTVIPATIDGNGDVLLESVHDLLSSRTRKAR